MILGVGDGGVLAGFVLSNLDPWLVEESWPGWERETSIRAVRWARDREIEIRILNFESLDL